MASRKTQVVRTATEALKILWEEDFFRGWKKKAAVEQTLGRKGNHFSDAELGMALKRAKHLTRRGKRGGYEYIQKYPFVAEPYSESQGNTHLRQIPQKDSGRSAGASARR